MNRCCRASIYSERPGDPSFAPTSQDGSKSLGMEMCREGEEEGHLEMESAPGASPGLGVLRRGTLAVFVFCRGLWIPLGPEKVFSPLPTLAQPMSLLLLEALGGGTGHAESPVGACCVWRGAICARMFSVPLSQGLRDGYLMWHISLPSRISSATPLGLLTLTQCTFPGEEAVDTFVERCRTLRSDQDQNS